MFGLKNDVSGTPGSTMYCITLCSVYKFMHLEHLLNFVLYNSVFSVQVDVSGTADSTARNEELEFERNQERFLFLKWGAKVRT